MTIEEALVLLDKLFLNKPLTDLQEIVFRESWQGKTYAEIAENEGYDDDYIRDVGFRLWHNLSDALGEKVTKSNFQSVLRRYYQSQESIQSKQNIITNSQEDEFICPILDSCPHTLQYTHKTSTFKDNTKPHQHWGEAVDVSFFYGRREELTTLKEWIVKSGCHLVAILGMQGVGKTCLSVKLAQEIQGEFDYFIWRSLHEQPPLNQLLTTTIDFLSQSAQINLPETTSGKISLLIKYLRQHRCLLIFDGFEALFKSGEKAGTYLPGYEEYGELLQKIANLQHQSCLLVISQEKPAIIATLEGEFLPVRTLLLKGLQPTAAQKLLNAKGLVGSTDEVSKLIACYQGNPLALKIVASAILELFDGDISAFIQQGTMVFNGIQKILAQQINRLSSIEARIIYSLSLHQNYVSLAQLEADMENEEIAPAQLLEALESLTWRCLIESHTAGLSLQPWVREYAIEQFPNSYTTVVCRVH
ncbi:MAG: NB-ARC domain-containing protein [Calothrix sp. MO_167.B42]|nr:NB-ARC domain-containing protein [Calothrix sp. MO_167.B42]